MHSTSATVRLNNQPMVPKNMARRPVAWCWIHEAAMWSWRGLGPQKSANSSHMVKSTPDVCKGDSSEVAGCRYCCDSWVARAWQLARLLMSSENGGFAGSDLVSVSPASASPAALLLRSADVDHSRSSAAVALSIVIRKMSRIHRCDVRYHILELEMGNCCPERHYLYFVWEKEGSLVHHVIISF